MKQETRNSRNLKCDTSPLALWRCVGPCALDRSDQSNLCETMQHFELASESAWRIARKGDAGAAIGVAIRVGIKKRSSPQVVDLAMSAVLLCALKGDHVAMHFLAHILERRGAHALASSWADASRSAAMNATRGASPLQRQKADYSAMSAVSRG